jgi:hypothetical protein
MLNTSKAPDAHGVVTEDMRFPRPAADGTSAMPCRWALCNTRAAEFNLVLQSGRVPDAWKDSAGTPLHKPKAGPPSDPDAYRVISVSSCVGKVFGSVLLFRLQHWAEHHKLISPLQVAFRADHGCEEHVWTLTETLRHLMRRGDHHAAALFVDLRKAYDTVHRGALWHILRHMGVPEQLVAVLADWNSARRTRLRLDGVDGRQFTVDKGVAQGDVMSPLLFDLFIEGLVRYLASLPGVGVTVTAPGHAVRVPCLAYADDVCVLARGRAGLQTALAAVLEWAHDFGMEVGVGNGKTEAMMFRHPNCTPSPDNDTSVPLVVGTVSVAWTTSYRYLGFALDDRLTGTAFFNRMYGMLHSLVGKYYYTSDVTQVCSPAAQLEAIRTFIIGPVQYLLSLYPMGASGARSGDNLLDRMDTVVRSALRRVFRLPSMDVPGLLFTATSRLLPFEALSVRSRYRLWLDLCHPASSDALAPRVFAALRAEQRLPGGRTRAFAGGGPAMDVSNWVADTAALISNWYGNDDLPAPRGRWDHARCANVLARAGAVRRWANAGRLAAGVLDTRRGATARERVDNTGKADAPLRPAPPISHLVPLHYNLFPCDAASLGPCGWSTPLSVWGPGCSGSPLALTRLPAAEIDGLARLPLGRAALGYRPFHSAGREPGIQNAAVPVAGQWRDAAPKDGTDGDGNESDSSLDDLGAPGARARSVQRRLANIQPGEHDCPLCGGRGSTYEHMLLDCTAPELAALRAARWDGARRLTAKICNRLYLRGCVAGSRVDRSGHPTVVPPVVGAVWHALTTCGPASEDGRFILTRLALAATWPAQPVPPMWRLSRAMGALFDAVNVTPQRLRGISDAWTVWSASCLRATAAAWHAAQVQMQVDRRRPTSRLALASDAAMQQHFPRGSVFHTGLPRLLPLWRDAVNDRCEFCSKNSEHARGGTLLQDTFCNLVICRDCLPVSRKVHTAIASDRSPLTWLCPGCTDEWLRVGLKLSGDAAAAAVAASMTAGSPLALPAATERQLCARNIGSNAAVPVMFLHRHADSDRALADELAASLPQASPRAGRRRTSRPPAAG